MKKFSDKLVVGVYSANRKLAHLCLNAVDEGLPDDTEVRHLTAALTAADLISRGFSASGGSSLNSHGAQDDDTENMLDAAYSDGGNEFTSR